jgi:tetratricopeptide (TPR) repeat protein
VKLLLFLCLAGAGLSQQPERKWRDLAEQQLYLQIAGETDAGRRVGLLDVWTRQYPSSDFKKERLDLYIASYRLLGRPAAAFDSAQEALKLDPADPNALYCVVRLTPAHLEPKEANLQTAEQWASRLLSLAKPVASTAEWDACAHRALGWIARQQGDRKKAEAAFIESLKRRGDSAEVSLWLGEVIAEQQDPERTPEVLYHFARASTLAGSGGLPIEERTHADVLYTRAYQKYRGDDRSGMKELRDLAVSRPFPPPGFKLPGRGKR